MYRLNHQSDKPQQIHSCRVSLHVYINVISPCFSVVSQVKKNFSIAKNATYKTTASQKFTEFVQQLLKPL
jgi:hypothetical protein